jgi:hypothetical protein
LKDAKTFVDDFARTWNSMLENNPNVKMDIITGNFDGVHKAFSEEKKIVATYDSCKETSLLENKTAKLLEESEEER